MKQEQKINMMFGLQVLLLLCIVVTISVVLYLRSGLMALGFYGDSPQPRATMVWSADAAERIVNGYSTFSLNTSAIQLQAERINTVAIGKNAGTGSKELEELLADCGNVSVCTNTLGAIEIFYAVANGNFKLYYKPVVFCQEAGARYGQGGHYYAPYTRQVTGTTYYKYNSATSSFVAEATNDALTAIAAYKTTIRIKRPSTNSPAPNSYFYTDPDHDVYSDVTSVIMPIDEFLMFTKTTSQVCLWNAQEPLSLCETEDDVKTEKNVVKHVIILSSANVTENYGDRTMYYYPSSQFSDMSHLCPPSCNASQFLFALKEVPN